MKPHTRLFLALTIFFCIPTIHSHGQITRTPGIATTDLPTSTRTRLATLTIEDPAVGDDGVLQAKFPNASTITRVSCSTSSGTVDINLYERAESAANSGTTSMLTDNLTCNNDGTADATTIFTDASVAANSVVALGIKVDSSTGVLRVYIHYTVR